MMGRKATIVLIIFCLLGLAVVNPPRAHAIDIEESLIIAGATAGAVALIALIAILASSDDDVPDFLTEAPKRRDREAGMQFGFEATRFCPTVGGNISLACW